MKLKAYFVDAESERLYEISAFKRERLERLHPNWFSLTLDDDEFQLVNHYFKTHGKLLASPKLRNIFVGMTN